MKKLSSLFFLLFLFIFVNAQENWKAGYILTNNNDTIHGLIDFGLNQVNVKRCRFKLAENTKYQDYMPGEIKAYRLPQEGRYYLTLSVPAENENNKTVFAEYLIQGKMNLYYCKYDAETEYYYMEKERGTLHAITKKPDRIERSEDRKVDIIKTDLKYKGFLSYLLHDVPVLDKEIKDMDFDRRSMIKLSENYHKETCAPGEKCIVFENDYTKKYTEFHFSIYGGYSFYEFSNRYVPSKSHGSAPLAGIQLNISDDRFSKRLSLLLDISFSESRTSGKRDYYPYYSYNYKSFISGLGAGVRWTAALNKRFRPSIEIGIGESVEFGGKYKYTREYTDGSVGEFHIKGIPVDPFWHIGIRGDYLLDKKKKNSIFFKVEYDKIAYDGILFWKSSSEDNYQMFRIKSGYSF